MNSIKKLSYFLIVGLMTGVLSSCFHDDDESGGLSGTWRGTIEDSIGTLSSVEVVFSGKSVESISIGGVNQNLTGTITKEPSSTNLGIIFSVVLSDTTEGGFFVDKSKNYIAYVDEDGSFAVLQKDGNLVNSYIDTDIVGSWSGYEVFLDSFDLSILEESASSATVLTDFSFTGSGIGGAYSGNFATFHTVFGEYNGAYTQGITTGTVSAFVSSDKQFAATYGCENGIFSFNNCSFAAWVKQ